MARVSGSPSRDNSRVAWVVTSPRRAQVPARARCSACGSRLHPRWRQGPRMADRIALVEDDRLVRELVAVNLRHAGYEIVAAEKFEEGKQMLAQGGIPHPLLRLLRP